MAGSGTITIRATNSEGNADWTVSFVTTLGLAAPSFADPTGDQQSWTINVSIIPVNVPEADGNPTPTYAIFGALPAGISFDVGTRALTGTPISVAFGTITIRAANSEGHADWTVTYSTQDIPVSTIPVYRLRIDWEGNGTYVDEWDYVLDIREASAGKDYDTQIYGRNIAGRLIVTLANDEGRFLDSNPNSPLYERINVRKAIGIDYSVAGNTWNLWWGYIDDIAPIPHQGGQDLMEITALGILSLMINRQVSTPLYQDIECATAVGHVLDEANIAIAQRESIQGDRMMANWWAIRQSSLIAVREIEETQSANFREQSINHEGPAVLMEPENYRVTGARLRPSLTLSDDTLVPGAQRIIETTPIELSQDIANVVFAPLRTFDNTATEEVIWTLAQTFELSDNESIPLVAKYPTENSPRGHVGVRSWVTPAPTIDYTANSLADGTGTDLTSALSVVVTDTSQRRRMVLMNTGSVTMYITRLQARGIPLIEVSSTDVEVRDEASIAIYEELEYVAPSQFLSTFFDVQIYATFLLRLLSVPRTRVKLVFDASDYLQAGNRPPDQSDRVAVSLSGVLEDMFIEGVNHKIRRGRQHNIELLLSPAAGTSGIIVLGEGPPIGTGLLGR